MDIKKEKPFFNPEVEWQTQARTDCNQASDVIGKADTVWSRNHRNRARGWGRSSRYIQPGQVAVDRGRKGREPVPCAVSLAEEIPQELEKYQKTKGVDNKY